MLNKKKTLLCMFVYKSRVHESSVHTHTEENIINIPSVELIL